MSTSQNQNQNELEALRSNVRQTIDQLNEFSLTADDYRAFCQRVLDDVVEITEAHGVLLWERQGDELTLAGFSGAAPDDAARQILALTNSGHTQMISEVISRQVPFGIASDAFLEKFSAMPSAESESDGEPTVQEGATFLMLLAPLLNEQRQCYGALELVQRSDMAKNSQEGYLRFMTQIATLFQNWHERQNVQRLSMSAQSWSQKVEFVNEIHQSIDVKETAYRIANEARRLLKADRVSVGKWNGRKCKIIAISSQDRFDNRSNVVRKLSSVATESVRADTPFWITGDTTGIAPVVARKINAYLDESNGRTFGVIPLVRRDKPEPGADLKKRKQTKPVKLGVLIVEYFDRDVPRQQIDDDCELIVQQSQLALNNARKHNEIFLAPVWKRLGWLQKLLFRDHLARTITGLIAATALLLLMIFMPIELKMKVDGVMQPRIRQNVYAQTAGVVKEILVDENSDVTVGQPLLKMQNVDLEVQMNQTRNQVMTLESQLEGAEFRLARRDDRDDRRDESLDAGTQAALLRKQLDSQNRLLELLQRKQELLVVTSPIQGQIVTRDPQRRLADLPVNPSQLLLSINRPEGPWELEIRIPQHKIAYVDDAIGRSEDEPLMVEYATSTNPNLSLEGRLLRVSDRTFPDEQGVPHYRGIVECTDVENLEKPRPGARVTAKVRCGKQSLGFYCFYQIWDWLRMEVLF